MIIVFALFSIVFVCMYVAWGVYTLRLRYVHHEELSLRSEFATIGGVTAFYMLELGMLRSWMSDSIVLYIFTVLALVMSGAALFGPMFVSVVARVFVDAIHPVDRGEVHTPHFGPAESLEEIGDYEGALNEYKVVARIFPGEPEPMLRAAGCWIELSAYGDAATALERALNVIEDPEHALLTTNRLADLYARELNQNDDAERVLRAYLENFPDIENHSGITRRLERLTQSSETARPVTVSDRLEIPGEPSE